MAFNEKGQWVEETPAPVTPWRQGYQAPNVPAPAPIADSVPVREAGGNIVPAPDTSGLYAIYGRKNTAADKADRYSRMAGMDMGGKLGQLPGIVAAFKAGRAEKQAAAFEKQKDEDVKAFMERKKEWDKIKGDEEQLKMNAEKIDRASASAWDAFSGATQNGKTWEEAGPISANAYNESIKQSGAFSAPMTNMHLFKGGHVEAQFDAAGKKYEITIKGNTRAWNDNGKMKPVPEGVMGIKERSDMMDAETKRANAGAKSLAKTELGALVKWQADLQKAIENSDEDLTASYTEQLKAVVAEANRRVGVKPGTPAPKPVTTKQPSGVIGGIKSALGIGPQTFTEESPAPGSGQQAAAAAPSALSPDAQAAAAWIKANPNAPASQIAAIKAQYKLQ